MSKRLKRAILKALTGLCINLSAGWFAVAFITPNFFGLNKNDAFWLLIYDLIFGIIFLVLTVFIEFLIEE